MYDAVGFVDVHTRVPIANSLPSSHLGVESISISSCS
jgi:hypothetical protein